jgi:hypothetical protein
MGFSSVVPVVIPFPVTVTHAVGVSLQEAQSFWDEHSRRVVKLSDVGRHGAVCTSSDLSFDVGGGDGMTRLDVFGGTELRFDSASRMIVTAMISTTNIPIGNKVRSVLFILYWPSVFF